jgi:SAM-dependent methyltransferase
MQRVDRCCYKERRPAAGADPNARGHVVTRDLVEACYRAILGREPEAEAVIREKMQAGGAEALIREFLLSEEFMAKRPGDLSAPYWRPPQRVDVDPGPDELRALFERLREQWRRLGEAEPFWSVLTHDEFRSAQLTPEAVARFYQTGAADADLIGLFCSRNRVSAPGGVCLEFGCGVGRVTTHLAGRFQRVIGVDISAGNLRHCREEMRRSNLDNVELVLLEKPEDVAALGPFDVLFSTIVLQHNPPPVQAFLLQALLGGLAPGGAFVFQTQTSVPDYQFDTAAHLASPVGAMDMHCLPMPTIFDILRRSGLRLCEVAADHWTGAAGSYTFFGVNDLGTDPQ